MAAQREEMAGAGARELAVEEAATPTEIEEAATCVEEAATQNRARTRTPERWARERAERSLGVRQRNKEPS